MYPRIYFSFCYMKVLSFYKFSFYESFERHTFSRFSSFFWMKTCERFMVFLKYISDVEKKEVIDGRNHIFQKEKKMFSKNVPKLLMEFSIFCFRFSQGFRHWQYLFYSQLKFWLSGKGGREIQKKMNGFPF